MTAIAPLPRILLIGNGLGPICQFRLPLIKALVAQGNDTHVLVPTERHGLLSGYDQQIATLRSCGATVHEYELQRTGTSVVRDLRSLVALYQAIRKIRPDVAISNMMKPVIYGTLAAWVAGVPRRYAMLDGLGIAFAHDGQHSTVARIAKFLLARALARTQHLILLNNDDPATLRREGVIGAGYPITIVAGTGIDLSYYDTSPIDSSSQKFVMIARLIREKGVGEYAAAAAIIHKTWPDATFQLIGEVDSNPGGITMNEIRSWSAIKYLGPQRDIRPFIRSALALVLPSYYGEGRPRTVMEAMSMGRPAVVADNQGSRDCVFDNVNGRVVPPRDAAALAEALMEYLREPDLAAIHGAAGRKLAESDYEESAVTRRILASLGLDV